MDRRIFLIGLGAFAVSTVAFVFAGLLPLIAASTGITVAQAGYLVAAYSVSYALFTPVLSAMTGRFNRRYVVSGALVAFILGTMLTAFSASMVQLVLAQVITGMAAGLFAATGQVIAIALADPERRARAIAMVVGGTTFAVALGAPLGSFFAHFAGWRMAFAAIGAVATICLIALWVLLPRNIPGARLPLSERLAVVRRPGVARLNLATLIYLSGAFAIVAYFGPIAIDGAGLSPDLLPLVLLIYGAGAIAGNMISGRLADSIGGRRMVIASMSCGIAMSLLLAGIIEFLPSVAAGPLLMLLLFVWGVVGWAFPPAQTSRLVAAAPDAAHLSLALQVSAIYLGIAFGTFAGGRVLEVAHVSALGLVAALFSAVALALVLTEKHQRRLPEPARA